MQVNLVLFKTSTGVDLDAFYERPKTSEQVRTGNFFAREIFTKFIENGLNCYMRLIESTR